MFVYLYCIWVFCCVFVFSCIVWGACHIGLCLQATLLARQEKFGQVKYIFLLHLWAALSHCRLSFLFCLCCFLFSFLLLLVFLKKVKLLVETVAQEKCHGL